MTWNDRFKRGLDYMVGRARSAVPDDTGPVQTLQGDFGSVGVIDKLKRLAEFGFTSVPPDNSDIIAIFLAGDRSNGVVIATGNQNSRFKNLQSGESALYNAFGMSVHLTENGIVVNGGNEPVTVNNAKGVTVNTTDNVVLNMNGNNVTINNPGAVVLGPAGKAVVMDGDPVSGGVVHASQTVVKV
ncbi:MAG TPA: phage baseplate assembly protein V [Rhizomicrobium sp.]|jgi:phage baseplate assembly protein V